MISILDNVIAEIVPEVHREQWKENVRWRDKRLPSVWATQERKLAAGQSPLSSGRTIPYLHEVMPHCVEPMDAADESGVREIVLWLPRRDGKTTGICLNILGRTVVDDPCNVYSVHPTADNAHTFSTGDLEPMIDACLANYFTEKRSRDPGRTIFFKKFIGGWIRIVNAGSLTKFHGTTVRILFLHELDKLDPEAIFKALGRTTGFADAIVVKESTGTFAPTYNQDGEIEYHSNIHEAYDQSDKRKWFCPCRKCNALQWLKYDQLWFPSGKMERAVYLCERCEADHNESQWRQMQADASWFSTAGLTADLEADIRSNSHKARAIDRTVRGYWRNGFNSLLPTTKGYKTKLHQFVAEGQGAKTSPKALMVWKNEIECTLWDPSTEGEAPPPWKPIWDRREDYGLTVPEGGLFLTAFIDCQLNRLEVGWRAWGRGEENWGMDHVVLDGHVRDREVWLALRQELSRRWDHALGCEIKLGMSFVDGGHYAEDVYRFMQMLARNPVPGVTGRCRASKGVGLHGHPVIDRKWRTVAKALKGYHIGTWEAKDRIYERLRMEPEDNDTREGRMHFNKQFDEEYCKGLVVETVTITYERGQEIRKYVNPQQQRNEPLDIEVGNLAAVRLHPRNFDVLEAELKRLAGAKDGKIEKPAPPKPQPRRNNLVRSLKSGGGW